MNAIRVLLVDDNTVFLKAATKFLNSLPGMEVVARATSAAEGLAQVAALRPDLVLMDVVMPGINGLKAVSLIKQSVDAPKIIVVTLHNTEAYRCGARTAGADGFIAKDDLVLELPPLLESLFPPGGCAGGGGGGVSAVLIPGLAVRMLLGTERIGKSIDALRREGDL